MNKAPAFQVYAADFLTDDVVIAATNEQVGIYWKLLLYNWINDSIPGDIETLARMVGTDLETMQEAWTLIGMKFQLSGKVLQNPRLKREKKKQDERRKKRRAAGKKGAENRWTDGDLDGKCHDQERDTEMASAITKDCTRAGVSSSSSSSSSLVTNELVPRSEGEREEEKPVIQDLPNVDAFEEMGSDVEGWQRVLQSRLKAILGIDLAIFQTERLLDGFFREFDEKELKEAIPAVLNNIVKRKPTNAMAYLKALARDGGLKEFAKSEPVGAKPPDPLATLGRNEDELSDEDNSAEAERFRAMVHERAERARF